MQSVVDEVVTGNKDFTLPWFENGEKQRLSNPKSEAAEVGNKHFTFFFAQLPILVFSDPQKWDKQTSNQAKTNKQTISRKNKQPKNYHLFKQIITKNSFNLLFLCFNLFRSFSFSFWYIWCAYSWDWGAIGPNFIPFDRVWPSYYKVNSL